MDFSLLKLNTIANTKKTQDKWKKVLRQLQAEQEELQVITEEYEGEKSTRMEYQTNQAANTENEYYEECRRKGI